MGSSLKQQLISGVFYTALAKYSGIFVSLAIVGVLSRLLPPEDFGVATIATVVIAFFSLLTDMGISPAIVQHKTLTEKDLSDIFSFTLWLGFALAVLFYFASWPVAYFYDNNVMLRNLCQLLSINLFFASANIVPNALFYKNKEFKFIAIRSFSIQVASGGASIVAALCGAGLYALIISPIVSSILVFVISIKRYPQQARMTLGLNALRKIFSYSAYQLMFNIINYFSRNMDKLLMGKYMSMTQLGYYQKSYQLMMLPLQNITQVITPVMHPIFSDYQNDKQRLGSSYERIIRLLAFIGMPFTALFFFTSSDLVPIIFGDQWGPSIPVLKILSLSVGVQIILSSSGSIYQAAGDTRSMFICGLFSSVLNVSGMLLGLFYWGTMEAVATCIVITFTINFVQCYWMMYRVTLKRSLWLLVKQLISPLIVSLLIAAVLLPIQYLTDGWDHILQLMVKGSASLLILGVYIQRTHEYDIIGKLKKWKVEN